MKPIIHSSQREAWLAARDEYFCGSEIAQLFGEGYAERESDRDKQRQIAITAKALRERFPEEESLQLAGQLEHSVLRIAAHRWWPTMTDDGMLRSDPMCERLAATPDAIVWDGKTVAAVVDCKISSTKAQEDIKPIKRDGTPSTASFVNGCPLYYAIQLQAQMAVTGASEGWLVVLHHVYPPGMKLRRYLVPRHEAMIARIRQEVTKAWAEVECIRSGRIAI